MKMKTRIIPLIICISLLLSVSLPLSLTVGAVDEPTISLDDGKCVAGEITVVFYSPDDGETNAYIDGNMLKTEKIGTFALICTAAEVDYKNSCFTVGDKSIGLVSGNGDHKFRLDPSMFSGDELKITFLPSVGTDVLDTSKVYGTYNIDDMIISDLKIELPNGDYVRPSKLIMHYPIVGASGVTEKEVSYNGGNVSVGDGWSAATGMGGSTPDKPISFSAVFDLKGNDLTVRSGTTLRATVNTADYDDGEHIFSVTSQSGSKEVNVVFDNTPPVIGCNIKSGDLISGEDVFEITAEDESGCSFSMRIDNNRYLEGKAVNRFVKDAKTHVFIATATDSLGNTSSLAVEFRIKNPDIWQSFTAADNSTLDAEGTLYGVTPLEIGSDGNVFTVDANDGESIMLRYSGTTSENVMIALKVLKNDGEYESVGRVMSGDDVYLTFDVKPEYVKDGKLTVKAEEYVYSSESDTVIWISDTQYYTRFEDLLDKYEADLDYYSELYKKGEAGFLIHTGDVADDYSPSALITAQMKAASQLHAKLDEQNIPYGIVNGNHDVGQSLHDSSFFSKFFGASRFADTSWYYGSLNNNESHYDLITLNGYDFVLVWLGYGVEADPATVAWANDVLQRFCHRNAIILTHAYLDVDADWVINKALPDDYTHSRAEEIWNYIVVPNENVKAVFCGHTPGVSRNLRKVDENRSVWEVLSDYQFYEDGTEPKHVINGCTCDGEGFVRIVTFDGKEMSQTTYSPYNGKKNPFGAKDEFTVPLVLTPSSEHILTTSAFEAYKINSKTDVSGETVIGEGKYLLSAAVYALTEPEASEPSDSSAAEGGEGSFPIVPVGIAVAAIAVVAVVIAIIKKKH